MEDDDVRRPAAGRRPDGPPGGDGAIDGELFEAYARQQLVPAPRPGGVVVMDNLAYHKRAGVGAAIEAAWCRVLYPPPYGPESNPIEQAFAKLEAPLRKAGERTVEGLWRLLGRVLDVFTPEECRNFRSHCGSRATPT